MTASSKAKRRPYATQKYVRTTVEHRSKIYRLSTRRADTDWDCFHESMQSLVDSCRDPEYRARLERLAQKG